MAESAESSAIPPTLLSAIQETSMPDNIQTSGLHPFSSSSDKTIAFLHSLLDTTARVAHSVTLHSTTAVNDSRTVSLLREQSTGQHLLHLVAKTISAAQERRRSDTWYDGPPTIQAAAGTLVLGGKVLVLDVALIREPFVHASYAGSAEGRDSPTMDAFFSRLVSGVSKGGDGRRLRDALGYVMCLDELAAHEGNGARWFSEVDVLTKELAKFTQAEAAFLVHPWSQAKIRASGRAHALMLIRQGYEIFTQLPTSDATLTLVPLSALPHTPPSTDPLLSGRPSFPLAPNAIGFAYDFPLPAGPDAGNQSRMLEIARAVQLQELSYPGTGPSLSYMTGSWVDMLLNSEGALSSERYTATYVSPTNMHPPLRLTLTAPDEPGFLLERVQVYNMQEAWAILEIVREQCWLNEVLNGIAWMPEVVVGPPLGDSPDAEATEEIKGASLRHLYSGFNTSECLCCTRSYGADFPRAAADAQNGAAVEVHGAIGADVQMATLEEAVRRGGALGLPGRVWAASHTAP
ncbi:hypothetical protein EDB89DRAFT_2230226 [Lactarius sanguifluus]|nr:hypothetical protein EDB89DRAFT_2230226 [Lactarius sanguifluus]